MMTLSIKRDSEVCCLNTWMTQ